MKSYDLLTFRCMLSSLEKLALFLNNDEKIIAREGCVNNLSIFNENYRHLDVLVMQYFFKVNVVFLNYI